jgi:hypothetical protein
MPLSSLGENILEHLLKGASMEWVEGRKAWPTEAKRGSYVDVQFIFI